MSGHGNAMTLHKDVLKYFLTTDTELGVADLLARDPAVPRRTLQRRLAALEASGDLVAVGRARSRRYRRPSGPHGAQGSERPDRFPTFIALSPDSGDVLRYVDQPLPARKPVGYQPSFLGAYQPNETHYLPQALRRQLHQMGRTADVGQRAGTYSRAILNRLLIDLSWASSHLEGNTYSRLDTRALIEHGTVAQGKAATETQMILNHKAAIELLVENIDEAGFDQYTLLNLHSALSENLMPNPGDEGRVRQHAVDIGASVYRPLSGEAALHSSLDQLLDTARQISDPFEQSFFALVHLPYLQPFADMNKRTARLLANVPLFKANLCPLTFLDVPAEAFSCAMLGVYEMTRVELLRDLYVWAYERSTQEYRALRQELAEPDPLRLAWRELIKATVQQVISQPHADPLSVIEQAVSQHVAQQVPPAEAASVQALIVEELRRMHHGVLARYGLRPSQWAAWQSIHQHTLPTR
jgi:Fic family protein